MAKRPKVGPAVPGDGEVWAQQGYTKQYGFAARVIYEYVANGSLEWLGLADKEAGQFDDVVVGLHDRTLAFQVKSSQDPTGFNFDTLMLRGPDLLGRMLKSRSSLKAAGAGETIETIYVCEDYPNTTPMTASTGPTGSSAAFLRVHAAGRLTMDREAWRASTFGPFIADVQNASGLDDGPFMEFWRNARFIAGNLISGIGAAPRSSSDRNKIDQLADAIPHMVSRPRTSRRWTVKEVLQELGWTDPFGQRHSHTFPIDALYQSNKTTESELAKAIELAETGYVSLVGPPGSGKSTILQAGLRTPPKTAVIRYLAFLPNQAHDVGRAEASDFLSDLVARLKQIGLGRDSTPGEDERALRSQFSNLLAEAGERFRTGGGRTLFSIDGLDHVPRESEATKSFLTVLPQPQTIPKGVVFILGTQKLDLEGLPPAVRDQAGQQGRQVSVRPLSPEAVARIAQFAKMPDDVHLADIYERTGGHPLSVRYVIEGLNQTADPSDRRRWLSDGPQYADGVDLFYQRAWNDLEGNARAHNALGYLALAEGAMDPERLATVVGDEATEAVWSAARHLMVRNAKGHWTLFHNSFRLFLITKTITRFGGVDQQRRNKRYSDLAHLAETASPDDPQRWMQLRYRARSKDHSAVAKLATPDNFRKQLADYRDPRHLFEDIGLAFRTAGALRDVSMLVELVLLKHEIQMRCDAIGDETFSALIRLGQLEAAANLVDADGTSISTPRKFELVDAYHQDGRVEAARALFERLQPLAKLTGSEASNGWRDEEVFAWIDRALLFRTPREIREQLAQLRGPEHFHAADFDMRKFRRNLRLRCAKGELDRNPAADVEALLRALLLPSYRRSVMCFAAEAAHALGDRVLASRLTDEALSLLEGFQNPIVGRLAVHASRNGQIDQARRLLEHVGPPTLAGKDFTVDVEGLRQVASEVFTFAECNARVGNEENLGLRAPSGVLALYQGRLECLGRLTGLALAKKPLPTDPMAEFRTTLNFLSRARGGTSYDSERHRLDQVMDDCIAAMVRAARACSEQTFQRLKSEIDTRLDQEQQRIGNPNCRRASAVACHSIDGDTAGALRRLGLERRRPESTPSEALSETARDAVALADLGLTEMAATVFEDGRRDGVGYTRAAKKDPQYVLWRESFCRAFDAAPGVRPNALLFFGRIIDGLSKTAGYDAGGRLSSDFLTRGSRLGRGWGQTASNLIQRTGRCGWVEHVQSLLCGIVDRSPEAAGAAGIIYGRIALPFRDHDDDDFFSELIAKAPADLIGGIALHAIRCLATDGEQVHRARAVGDVVKAAALRDVVVDNPFPIPCEVEEAQDDHQSGNLFKTAATIEEFNLALQQDDGESPWDVKHAFLRLVSPANYHEAIIHYDPRRSPFDDSLLNERLLSIAKDLGLRVDCDRYLRVMKVRADDDGSWSSVWGDDSKFRYHCANIMLNGPSVVEASFESLASDLAARKQGAESLLPDLPDVLAVVAPHYPVSQLWSQLCVHLTMFREYRLGDDLEKPEENQADDPSLALADILFLAVDITASDLRRVVRESITEFLNVRSGANVVVALVKLLWSRGGDHALEGSYLAWQCRDDADVRDGLVAHFPDPAKTEDYGVRSVNLRLARLWGQRPYPPNANLPAFYALQMPDNPMAEQFDPPSGLQSTSRGLWTTDPLAWTFPLRMAVTITANASEQNIGKLRIRVAQLMQRMGGEELFGPAAFERQQERLKCLDLLSQYRRQSTVAAHTGMREVLGELVAADAIDLRAVPLILSESGGFCQNLRIVSPIAKPSSIPSVSISDMHASGDVEEWLANAVEDAAVPRLEGYVVLGATARHRRSYINDHWEAVQFYGPATGANPSTIESVLRALTRVMLTDQVLYLDEGLGRGAIVSVNHDAFDLIRSHSLALCKRVAGQLGWRSDADDLFTFRDEKGDVMAKTVHWRDGGLPSRRVDGRTFSRGQLVVVRADAANAVRPFLDSHMVSHAWRGVVDRADVENRWAGGSLPVS